MPDKARGAVGIPQVIQTPVRLKVLSEIVRESILGKEAKARPAVDDFNTFADFAEALAEALDRATNSKDLNDWQEFRDMLGDWPEPVAILVPELDGTGNARTWLFERIAKGLAGHRLDGTASLYWSEERGILSWSGDQLPAKI